MIQKEVLKGTRFWGTHGKYVKRNMLLGFVNEIGHDVKSIADSIMKHAIEDDISDDTEADADQTGLAIVAHEVVRRTKKKHSFSYDSDLEDNDAEERDAAEDEGAQNESLHRLVHHCLAFFFPF